MIKEHPTLTHVFVSSDGKKVFCHLPDELMKYNRTPKTEQYIAPDGRVCYSYKVGRDRYGYCCITLPKALGLLYFNVKRKKCKMHRLVAQTFIPNTGNYDVVDHYDNNPANNDVSNLRWVDLAANNRRSNKGLDCRNRYTKQQCLKALDLMVNCGVHYKEVSVLTGIQVNTLVEAKRQKTWKKIWERFNDYQETEYHQVVGNWERTE